MRLQQTMSKRIYLKQFTLPEFAFLEATSHDGNPLEGRDVLQHIRSYTILEVLTDDNLDERHMTVQVYPFTYRNPLGVIENHAFAVHFTLADELQLPEIIEKCIKWYCDYLAWEDKNIIEDTKNGLN